MKNLHKFTGALLLTGMLFTTVESLAQEHMKIKLQTEENINGKLVKLDTVLHIKEGEDPQEVIRELHEKLNLPAPDVEIKKHKSSHEDEVSVNIEDDGTKMTISITKGGEKDVIVVPSGSDAESIIRKHTGEPKGEKRVIVKKRSDDKGEKHDVEIIIEELDDNNFRKGEMESSKNQLELNDFKIFPNPSKGELSVSFESTKRENTDLKVYNSSGRLIMEKNLGKLKGKFSETFNLGDVSPGIYFVQVWQGNSAKTSKLIVK